MSYEKICKELSKKIEKDFGKPCSKSERDFAFGCANCSAWDIFKQVQDLEKFCNPKNWKPLKNKK